MTPVIQPFSSGRVRADSERAGLQGDVLSKQLNSRLVNGGAFGREKSGNGSADTAG
jgi:hypothetical protein